MNKTVLAKHEIYNKLSGLSEQDLASIANFVNFMRQQKNIPGQKNRRLQGIIADHYIDLNDLKQFRNQSWKHVDQEFFDE